MWIRSPELAMVVQEIGAAVQGSNLREGAGEELLGPFEP